MKIENAIKQLNDAGFETIKETEHVFVATHPNLNKSVYFSLDFNKTNVDIYVTPKCPIMRSCEDRPMTKMIDVSTAIEYANAE